MLRRARGALTAPDAVFGTVDYMSPEQIRLGVDGRSPHRPLVARRHPLRAPHRAHAVQRRRALGHRADRERARPPADAFVPTLPPSLVGIVMKALEKDPDQRFQSAEELRGPRAVLRDVEPITSVLARLPPQRAAPEHVALSSTRRSAAARDEPRVRDRPAEERVGPPCLRRAAPRRRGRTAVGLTLWKSDLIHPPRAGHVDAGRASPRRPSTASSPPAAARSPLPLPAAARPRPLLGVSAASGFAAAQRPHAKRPKPAARALGDRADAAARPPHDAPPRPPPYRSTI